MPTNEPTGAEPNGPQPSSNGTDEAPRRTRRRAPAKTTDAAAGSAVDGAVDQAPSKARRASTGRKTTAAKATKAAAAQPELPDLTTTAGRADTSEAPVKATRSRRRTAEPDTAGDSTQTVAPATKAPAKRTRKQAVAVPSIETGHASTTKPAEPTEKPPAAEKRSGRMAPPTTAVLFMAPELSEAEQARNTAASTSRATKAGSTAIGPDPDAPTDEPPRKATGGRTRAGAKATSGAAAAAPSTPAKTTRAARGRAAEVTEPESAEDEGRTRRSRRTRRTEEPAEVEQPVAVTPDEDEDDEDGEDGARRRRRGRRGRGRGKGTTDADEVEATGAPRSTDGDEPADDADDPVTRRRRRRRRGGSGADEAAPDEEGVVTVVRIRQPRAARDEVQGVTGSTRLEAKRQRRRDGREQRRTRPPILSESEFLARREAVDRVMVVRQKGDRTQVAVLEDGVLVEHYVTRQSASTMVGNVYLGKVQNVLPSMEAAFVDIGRGRNAVLYAGEVNWDASGLEGRARSIEQALKSGEAVLVQVTKDPVGHKGARLTSHVALSGRHLVYVPNGHASGISRKLSDVERRRLRDILKNLVPDSAGVIVRTAAEGAAEEDLERDVRRLQAQWEEIQKKATEQNAPALLSAEPDLVIRVVRDLFNEDFREVVIQGTEAYEQVESYLEHVSPDLVGRIRRYAGTQDAFAEWRIDEQILKGLDRKVYLPSGGHLVIDRTEAMTVVDVNTGKYTGAGGNLEETVTRNNLEAAEEIVRQLRLRDLGGIVVIDFIDMVLESNRELVLRRLTECLGRDRTKHQVTEITSLGLVQMTRKRIGQGLLEAFSETCDHCKGRGVIIQTDPVGSRASVAEKVRAVAASVPRTDTADDTDEVELPAPGDDNDLVTVEDEVEPVGAGRRRTRRGNSRRRTRP